MGNQCSHLSPSPLLSSSHAPTSQPASQQTSQRTSSKRNAERTYTHTHTHEITCLRPCVRLNGSREGAASVLENCGGLRRGQCIHVKRSCLGCLLKRFWALLLYAQQHHQGQQLGRGLTSRLAPFEDSLIAAKKNEPRPPRPPPPPPPPPPRSKSASPKEFCFRRPGLCVETRLETDIWGKHRRGGGGGGGGCAKQASSWWVVPFDLWPCFVVTNQAPR